MTSKFVLSTHIINTPVCLVHNFLSFDHGNTKSPSRPILKTANTGRKLADKNIFFSVCGLCEAQGLAGPFAGRQPLVYVDLDFITWLAFFHTAVFHWFISCPGFLPCSQFYFSCSSSQREQE